MERFLKMTKTSEPLTNISTFISLFNSWGRGRFPLNYITTNRMAHTNTHREMLRATCVSVDTTTHFLFRYLCVFVYAKVTSVLPLDSFSNSTTELLVDTTVCSICASFSFMESLGNNKRHFDDLLPSCCTLIPKKCLNTQMFQMSGRHWRGFFFSFLKQSFFSWKSTNEIWKSEEHVGILKKKIKKEFQENKVKSIFGKIVNLRKRPWTENKGSKMKKKMKNDRNIAAFHFHISQSGKLHGCLRDRNPHQSKQRAAG